MAYKITKHRRGTTQEWLDLDLIPEDGELVIEECEGGLRKCKVGDGVRTFSELPYITDALAEEIEKELESICGQFNNSLNTTIAELSQSANSDKTELSTSIINLDTKINNEVTKLSSGIDTLSNKISAIDTVIREGITTDIESLDASYSVALSEITTQHATDISVLTETIDNVSSELSATIDATISQVKSDLRDEIDNSTDALTEDFSTKISEVAEQLQTVVTKQEQQDTDIFDIQTSISDLDYNINNRIEAKIIENATITNATISDITTRLSQLNQAIEELQKEANKNPTIIVPGADSDQEISSELLTEITTMLDRLDYKVSILETNDTNADTELQKLGLEVKRLAASLSNIIDQQKTSSETLTNTLTVLDDKLSKANSDLSAIVATHHDEVSEEIGKLTANDTDLYQIIYRIHAELLNTIRLTQSNIQENISEEVVTINQTIDTLKDNVATDIANSENNIKDLVSATESKLANKIETVEKLQSHRLTTNETSIKNLTLATAENISNITDKLEKLTTETCNNTVNIASNKYLINQVTNALDIKVELLNEGIAALDDQIEAQANRISSIIALEQGSTTGDAELQDIRKGYNGKIYTSAGDAVRAIGTELNTLSNDLSQYIGTQAVDGLRYDYAGEVNPGQPYMLYLTANGEVIHESGVQIISGAGGSGGGSSTTSTLKIGYITQSPIIVTPSDKTIIRYTFSGEDSSGDIIMQATAAWKVNGVTVEYGVAKNGENEFDITKYIKTGTSKVLLTVTDDNGSVATKSWNVQQIELTIESSFNEKRKYTAGETIVFDYVPSGAIDKTAVFKLDGVVIDRVALGKDISGTVISYELPAQSHGAHLLDIYLEADINGDTVTSNHTIKDIIWYNPNGMTPVIGASIQSLTVKQYSTTNILYTVYDPNNENPTVTIIVDGVEGSPLVVTSNKDYGDTPTAIYSYTATTAGSHQIKIVCGSTEKVINVFAEDIGISVIPVTTGLAFDFNPAGRSNGDENRLWNYNNVHMTVSDNFDWINGGYRPDDPDGPCFCVKAGSTATIDYELFANEAKVSGKEFKLIFKTKNISNPEAIFLTCLDNTTDKDHIGIAMGAHSAHIYGKNGNLELAYSEDDVIEFEFNISKDTESVPMVMGYEDGVPSRPMVYDSTYSFKQNTPKAITIGSEDCDIYIYRFKVYNTSLSAADILKNFIADARTADEMVSRYNRNQIYDENQKLTAEVLAEKCPWLRVYKVSAPHFTNSKSDKVSNTTIQQIYHGGDPILDNWVAYNAQHSGQGTSSNNYGAAGRNLDFIMNKSDSYFELSDGTIANEITLTRTSVPVAYLNAKVNIASSNNLTNSILANRFNKFNPYKRPFVRDEGYPVDNIKDTMEFYNCVIFIQETDTDLTTHREFADTDWHFYAIGNIGDSKKTDKTRLTDQSDPYECCVEIMDVDLPLSAFPRDTMINAMSYTIDEKTNEPIYTWAKDSNLGILHEKQEDGTYVLTTDTTVDFDKTYYVDILEHDDFSEDFTYGWRYISDDEDAEIVATCKQAWIDFYRFVTTSTDDEFKSNLKDYFVVDSALYYYLFTTRYCMVDNRAKNTFWHYGKTSDGTHKWDLNWDYDNDTSLGLNNFGKQLYRYGLEDIDIDTAGKEVFRQSNSLFFCRIRDLFASELKQMYQTLESRDAWNANSFLNECDAWQEQFPEELWRVDIERKYIRTYNKSFINGAGDSQFLVNMANGRMKYHRRQWERGQEQYMASKYQTTVALGDTSHANFRVSKFAEGETDDFVIPTNYQFTLTPYSYIYLNVYYNSGSPISVRVTDQNINTPVVVPYAMDKADIINVGSASAIRDFGDLAPLYADTVSVANATRIKRLKIGDSTEGYRNAGLSTLTTGANGLLEELDLTNTSYNKTLDLRELINLKKLYASGTEIPGIIFAEGSKIEEVKLPAINSLTLKNLKYLSTAKLQLDSYDNVVDLAIEGCPLIDQLSLLESCTNTTKAKLDNIHFGTKTYEYFETNIFKIKGIDDNTSNAQIIGAVNIVELDGAQFNELKTRYPKLTVTYDTLNSIITFIGTDLETILYSSTIVNGSDCQDPTTLDGWVEPTKAATPEFTYSWFGWSETPNVVVNYEMLGDSAIDAEYTDYITYRVDSIKHVEGNRVLYPVFKATRNSYRVQFINPTNNNEIMYSVMTPYGSDANYVGATPQKLDTPTPSLFYFLGWSPSPINITSDLDCYAQFAVLDSTWYTINLPDITDCTDYSGNVFNGYTLNNINHTMAITSCKNKLNKAVKIPAQLNVNGNIYTITTVGGFRDHDNIELLSLPDTITEIAAHSFYSCNYLNELTIPENVATIGESAFQGCTSLNEVFIPSNVTRINKAAFAECTKLKQFTVDENNSYYKTLQNGQMLLEINTGLLLQGLSGSVLTSDMIDICNIGDYCFAYTSITSASIPEGITSLASNAFSHCESMTTVTLPNTLTKVGATCFAWCRKLANVVFNQGLLDIDTYAFNSCAIENLELPNTVNYVRAQSFGSINALKSVTFKARRNADNSIFVPYIDKQAFSGAGTEANPVIFNLPWTQEQHNSLFTGTDTDGNTKHPGFGAKHYTLNFI